MINIYYWFYLFQFGRSTSQIPKQTLSENKDDLNNMLDCGTNHREENFRERYMYCD